ncbi:superoxide dismutase [Coprobacter fastidiosus]|jgi:Fe-Mn family superoxide dismutase
MKRLKQIIAVLALSGLIFTGNPYAQNNTVKIKSENSEIILPPLPYAENELVPYISAQTVMLHYGKHLKGYVNNVNRLVKEISDLEGKDLETIVKQSEGALYNNAAQAWNHIFYFDAFSPHAQHQPSGELEKQINKQWGNFENFKTAFANIANNLFGSGWVWLIKNKNGTLDIIGESNAGNILKGNGKPLLGVDIWEHAYYLDYQNRRAEHIDGLWNIIDWSIVDRRYNE